MGNMIAFGTTAVMLAPSGANRQLFGKHPRGKHPHHNDDQQQGDDHQHGDCGCCEQMRIATEVIGVDWDDLAMRFEKAESHKTLLGALNCTEQADALQAMINMWPPCANPYGYSGVQWDNDPPIKRAGYNDCYHVDDWSNAECEACCKEGLLAQDGERPKIDGDTDDKKCICHFDNKPDCNLHE